MSSGSDGKPGGSVPADERPLARVRSWLLVNGLRLEVGLGILVLVVAAVASVVVVFGAIMAFPTGPPPENGTGGPPTGLLDLGTILINGGILLGVVLGTVLVIHAVVEVTAARATRHRGDPAGPRSWGYVTIRLVETAAGAGFAGIIVGGYTLSQLGIIGEEPPGVVFWVIGVCGLVMLASVLGHGTVRAIRWVVRS